ncbi:hypothetical protein GUJ93_ZPchr0012g20132 [Zizania palustris]|uniref:Uncharacterized protein n=1 Tax=Zizania palustris TaxID=103762 RepID=A0A8J6BSF0_ZIZPA|nr:hypothetical protein GUJ93_ZPchr0012g20132 [Zizania palustris]
MLHLSFSDERRRPGVFFPDSGEVNPVAAASSAPTALVQKTRRWALDLPTPLLLGLSVLFRLLSLKKRIQES